MSREDYEPFKELKLQRQAQAQRNRVRADQDFLEVSRLASEHDFILRRLTTQHYQLRPRDRSWILNVYPGNRRLFHDPHKRGPMLQVPANWTLRDVVVAAIAQRETGVST